MKYRSYKTQDFFFLSDMQVNCTQLTIVAAVSKAEILAPKQEKIISL